MDQGIVLAGLSELADAKVVSSYDEYKRLIATGKFIGQGELTMNSVFSKYYEPEKQLNQIPATKKQYKLFVRTIAGKKFSIGANPTNTIEDLKIEIRQKEGIPVEQQRLFHKTSAFYKHLENAQTLKDYNIENETELQLVVRLIASSKDYNTLLFTNDLDPQYDYDFTNVRDTESFKRGGFKYMRPCGWQRYAIKVLGKYGNDNWLGSTGSEFEEWPVSYHGTHKIAAASIVASAYDIDKQKRYAYGPGIYSSPDVEYARGYSTKFEYNGKNYWIVLQNRVNPKEVRIFAGENIFVVPNGQHIRPYGILIRLA